MFAESQNPYDDATCCETEEPYPIPSTAKTKTPSIDSSLTNQIQTHFGFEGTLRVHSVGNNVYRANWHNEKNYVTLSRFVRVLGSIVTDLTSQRTKDTLKDQM